VLARAARDVDERRRRERQVLAAALDEHGPDRAHALETQAKLGLAPARAAFATAAARAELRPYARWALAASGEDEDEDALADLLASDIALERRVAAYALMLADGPRSATSDRLLAAAAREPLEREPNQWLAAALHVQAADASATRRLLARLARGTTEDRRIAAIAFARRPDPAALPLLVAQLAHEDADARIYAAEAVLRASRQATRLKAEKQMGASSSAPVAPPPAATSEVASAAPSAPPRLQTDNDFAKPAGSRRASSPSSDGYSSP
jgi:hypothetical protein